jgi:hypothetical protein
MRRKANGAAAAHDLTGSHQTPFERARAGAALN